MGSIELLEQADRRLVTLVSGLGPADWDGPSPCADWNVRSLVSHTVASIDVFSTAVDGQGGPTEEELFSGIDILGPDPLDVVERAVERSHRAWASIVDWEQPVGTVLGSMAAEQAIGIITYSTLIHSWDLAGAVGATVEFTAPEATLAEAVGSQLVPALRPNGLFGAEVEVGASATPTERLVALAGRNPL